jgi:hypothetical protein
MLHAANLAANKDLSVWKEFLDELENWLLMLVKVAKSN